MDRSRNGQVIDSERRGPEQVAVLSAFSKEAKDLRTRLRAKAVLGYLDGKEVIALSKALDVSRGLVNRWIQWYRAMGAEGLRDAECPEPTPGLGEEEKTGPAPLVAGERQSARFTCGMRTGPMIGDLIHRRYAVRCHNRRFHIPCPLDGMELSMQQPGKRFAVAA